MSERQPKCAGRAQEIAKQLVGTWQEFSVIDGQEVLEGDLVTELLLGGCVLSNRFKSAKGGFEFISFAYVDPETELWFESYMFNTGRTTFWRWVEENGEIVTYNENPEAEEPIRLRIVNMTRDSYEVIEEKKLDGEWQFVVLTVTRRVSA